MTKIIKNIKIIRNIRIIILIYIKTIRNTMKRRNRRIKVIPSLTYSSRLTKIVNKSNRYIGRITSMDTTIRSRTRRIT
jgi:hypothetical protein